jgi:MarR family transcriptional regulator, temperature-dependent positive regulator of motility
MAHRHGGSLPAFSPSASLHDQRHRKSTLIDEIHYRLLHSLEGCPDQSQRQLGTTLGVSVGKINYCLRALMKKGWIRASRATPRRSRRTYLYLVTPAGKHRRVQMARGVLADKLAQVEAIAKDIARLRSELSHSTAGNVSPARDEEGS